jgi:hypothetical protein
VSAPSIKRRLAAIGELPGTDGQYSTTQLLKALYGDLSAEKLRKLRADRELTEAKLSVINRDYLPREGVINSLTNSLLFVRRGIEGSSMTEVEKRRLLKYLASPAVANLFNTGGETPNGEIG